MSSTTAPTTSARTASDIREAARQAISQAGLAHAVTGYYSRQVEAVIEALAQHEKSEKDRLAEAIREAAREQGLQSRRVEDYLVEFGLVEPTPEPEAEAPDTDTSGLRDAVQSAIEALQGVAARL